MLGGMPPFFIAAGPEHAMAMAEYRAPIGTLRLYYTEGRLARVSIGGQGEERPREFGTTRPLHEQVVSWLDAFFGRDPLPPLPPLEPATTPFRSRLRQALLAIPWGQTLTYGALARQLGSSPRAVGQACRANPIPLLVPCHRVVSAGGVGGFMGRERSDIKRWLLEHERGG